MTKVVDSFIFYNELDMLEYRLRTLEPVVDIFVLVEALQTHAGNPKILYYDENKARFAPWAHKIVHKIVDLPCKEQTTRANQWVNENQHRHEITRAVRELQPHLRADDLVMVSDLDEIPDPATIATLKADPSLVKEKGIIAFEQVLYYYNIETLASAEPWTCARISTASAFESIGSAQELRHIGCPSIPKGGWHLSYFGSPAFIRNKIQQFGHQELNSVDYTDERKIAERVAAGMSVVQLGSNLTHIPRASNNYLPPNIEWLESALAAL